MPTSKCSFIAMESRNGAVLITGGAKRLGLAMAAETLAMGLDVVIHYRSDRRAAQTWLARHPPSRKRVHFLQSDLTPDTAASLVDEARTLVPRLVGLVNNASTFTGGNLSDLSHLRAALDTNLLVPAALAEQFRRRAKRGWVINITDAHAFPLNRNYQNYRVSKLFLEELTRQQAFLFAPAIRVNAIAPGAILPSRGASRADFARLARAVPLGRTGGLADLRAAFAFLVRSPSVTGQTVFVDGGWHLLA
jgi:NAD(P)-dependent dehydrogenase (short-subunit alcohol dehydrogenase family)